MLAMNQVHGRRSQRTANECCQSCMVELLKAASRNCFCRRPSQAQLAQSPENDLTVFGSMRIWQEWSSVTTIDLSWRSRHHCLNQLRASTGVRPVRDVTSRLSRRRRNSADNARCSQKFRLVRLGCDVIFSIFSCMDVSLSLSNRHV